MIIVEKNSVTIPFFRVGCEAVDLTAVLRALKVIK